MHCTDAQTYRPNWIARSLAAGTMLLLAACSSVTTPPADTVGNAATVTANPYLAEPERAPQAARDGMEIAHRAYSDGNLAQAEAELIKLTEAWPKLSGLWLNLGIVQQRADKTQAAEQSLRQAIEVNDNNVFAWNQLAALLRDVGRFDQARQSYEAALQRWPDYGDAHRNLGILYDLYLHQPDKALPHYRAAQAALEEPDKQLAGWIVELERRL